MAKGATKTRRPAKQTSRRQDKKAERSLPDIDLSGLDDDQFQQLLDLAHAATEAPPEEDPDVDDPDDDDPDDDDPDDLAERRRIRRKKSKTKITVEKDSEDDDPDDEDIDVDDEDVDPAVELSDSEGSQALRIATRTEQRLAKQRWDHQRDGYLTAGVPAFLLDLAEPVMERAEPMIIDLSEEEELDVNETITQMLDGVKGIVDLTGEIGHQVDLSVSDEEKDRADALLDDWSKTYG